jgi:septal ring factor EnvC (AmiA/AmiB activator)
VNKCADYEEEIRNLRTVQANGRLPRSNTSESLDPTDEPRPSTANSASAKAQSRFSFLTGRRPSPSNSPSTPPMASESDLLSEDRARTVDSEIEELSVQLFSQANEMVADERRARAKLEERIEMLEKKDKDKVARLDRLEKAISRLDRVKALLNKESVLEVPGATGATLAPRTE